MNKTQKRIIEENGLVEIQEEERYNATGQLVYEKYSDGTECKYDDNGKLVYTKYSDGRSYIAGKYYEKKSDIN